MSPLCSLIGELWHSSMFPYLFSSYCALVLTVLPFYPLNKLINEASSQEREALGPSWLRQKEMDPQGRLCSVKETSHFTSWLYPRDFVFDFGLRLCSSSKIKQKLLFPFLGSDSILPSPGDILQKKMVYLNHCITPKIHQNHGFSKMAWAMSFNIPFFQLPHSFHLSKFPPLLLKVLALP